MCYSDSNKLATLQTISPTLSFLYASAANVGLEIVYDLYLSEPPTPLPKVPSKLPLSTSLSPYRPEVAQLVRQALRSITLRADNASESGESGQSHSNQSVETGSVSAASGGIRGGLAVIACGPEGIVTEAGNAVASLGIGERANCGGVAFHGECYAL
jgi:ferric-chelate reductase